MKLHGIASDIWNLNIGSRLFHSYQNDDVILRKFIHLNAADGIDGIEVQAVLYFYAVS